ncbi:MAG: hypothetical protein CVU79_01125 [Elusimicrobia bacterium HGW-Elusimicrobia-3]|jgi:DNA-binding response OmpR family regulator|nr:MAG: hypothetical protein CVU79_01125 [Elusimicrobia bacterium HGW-Elusimicrobia-3]
MRNLFFHIITADTGIAARWQAAFRKEGWQVELYAPSAAYACARVEACELDFVEFGAPCCRSGEELKTMMSKRMPLSVIVFGDQSKVSNSQISALLEAGADDFIYKNLDERVLVAKVKAHLRRIMPAILQASARCASSCGEIEVDSSRRAVKIKSRPGKVTELSTLTQRELDILAFLVGHEKQVVSREAMLEKLWGEDSVNVYCECVDKHIESLRRKLGLYGKRIRTVYGTGYMFTGKE